MESQILNDDELKLLIKKGQIDEYFSRVAEKEKSQSSFKNWVDKLLPRYQEAIEAHHSPMDAERHFVIAKAFFERAFSREYTSLSQITAGFVQQDFENWWLNEPSLPKAKKQELRHSLKRLFHFIATSNPISLHRYGFK